MKLEHLPFYLVLPQVFADLRQNNLTSLFDLVDLFKMGLVDRNKAEELKSLTRHFANTELVASYISLSVFHRALIGMWCNCSGHIIENSECHQLGQRKPIAIFATIRYSKNDNIANMPAQKKLDFQIPLQ